MDLKKHLLETVTLVGAAVLCALVANAIAPPERKVALTSSSPVGIRRDTNAAAREPLMTTLVATTTSPLPVASLPEIPPQKIAVAPAPSPAGTRPAATPPPPPSTPVKPSPEPVKPAAAEPNLLTRFPPHPDKAYVEIGGDDVERLHASGALFLDARRTSVFREGHIAGARPFSVWEADLDEKVKRLFDERGDAAQQLQPIVIYCSGGDCEDSHMLAEKLWGIQFNNLYVYKDGFPDWQKRGGKVGK